MGQIGDSAIYHVLVIRSGNSNLTTRSCKHAEHEIALIGIYARFFAVVPLDERTYGIDTPDRAVRVVRTV